MKQTIIIAIAAAAFFLLLGWAGERDFTEQTILHMSKDEYNQARQALMQLNDGEPSENDIAHWWVSHKRGR